MKTYQLSEGLQESLLATITAALAEHSHDWQVQVEEGVIDEEALTVFVAVGWIPSKRDSRLTLVRAE
jgi:hypothetical protein